MNQLFEECINDVGLRFKRKKKDSETIEISPQKETKNRQKLIKEKILPPKNPNLIDLKKSLEKLETFSKLKNENQPKNMVLEIIPEKNKEKQSIISEKNKELQTNELEKNFSSYPKLPNQINLNLNVDYYNKEVSPQLRWTLLIKEVANFEFNRIKLTYKNNPSFLKKCFCFLVKFSFIFEFSRGVKKFHMRKCQDEN